MAEDFRELIGCSYPNVYMQLYSLSIHSAYTASESEKLQQLYGDSNYFFKEPSKSLGH